MLSFIDIFCGAGFGARGGVSADCRPLLGVDSWELAVNTYKANFPDSDVICSRIEDLNPEGLAKSYKPDVLLASPECTSHSIARGAKSGSERSRETAINIVPWLDAFRPRWLIIENVNRMKQWDRHDELIETIESHNYTISDLYLNAADFGVPQSRKRMFLICDQKGTRITKESLLALHSRKRKSARSIIDWSGKYPTSKLKKPGRASATLERAERAIEALGTGTDFLIVYYGSDYAGGWQDLDSPLRTVTTLDRFGLVTWSRRTPYLRMLQPLELVRAMCGNRTHKLPLGNRREKIRLCGNGVCSPVLEIIFKRLALFHSENLAEIA